ncbi:MAG: ABC transporter permease [Acidobacteria bacterium]|nr:ABC transporter permease [Acidobacteriota bacterium]
MSAAKSERTGWSRTRWSGDYLFLLHNLVLRDFRIRYRNMSLGVFWSLLNPMVMMGVLWFVFTKIFPSNRIPNFAVFVLCGLVPYSFFTVAWLNGTTSLVDSATFLKRVPVPREVIPISSVLSNCVQIAPQLGLLFTFVLLAGKGVGWQWLWLIFVWACQIVFVSGLALISSGLNVYVRDIRYVVESANVVLFWLVPIFYDFSIISEQYRDLYQYNPVAALVLASRHILLDGVAPPASLLLKLAGSSVFMLLLGLALFRRLQSKFYNHL